MEGIHEIPEFDNMQADDEGWAIFGVALREGHHQLMKCDDMDVFSDDAQAWEFVVEKAKAGSVYHQSALEYLKEHNPSEFNLIVRRFPYPSTSNERSEPSHGTEDSDGNTVGPGDPEDGHHYADGSEEVLQGSRVPTDDTSAE